VADRGLHIGIDAREIVGKPTGVGRYVTETIAAWSRNATLPHRFTLFLPSPPPHGWHPPDPRFTVSVVPAEVPGTWWEQTALRRAANGASLDVFFGPGYTLPIGLTCPSVVLIHDVSFAAHPEWFGWREGLRRRWLTRASAARAAVIVTVSEFSASEMQRLLGVERRHVVIASPGAPQALPESTAPREPMVLSVGSLFARRRVPDLIRGFALACRRVPGARLVLVGDNRTHPPVDPRAIAAEAGAAAAVDWREYVPDAELDALYERARVFALLSEYEGFLMTPLEAFAHSVPAVLLDTPVTREIYGDSATLVASGPDAFADALVRLLTDDTAHRTAVAAGRARLAKSSWDATAEAVLTALVRAAKRT
jgi:glycosyltransferase involved in cell wall biosynthesis